MGRLTLLKQIARGGMGEVYLATSGAIEGAERPCVVKIIRREHQTDRSFLARFLDEARIQAQFQHPGVAQVLEAATDSTGKPFVVVEYVEGRNLGEVRSRAQQLGVRIPWADAVAVGIAMADALAHVHQRTDAEGRPLEIAHRDLSPQNVMLSYGGDVKLIDFGTARGLNRRCHTVSGVVFAKPGYVAPEVANNTPGGAPADLYAFGIMLWELIAGRRFLSGDAAEHLAAVGAGERNPTPLAQLVEAPKEIDAIVAKLTAARIEDRYPSAGDAMSQLSALLKQAPSLANGERGVRARIAQLIQRLYPAEPARSRAEFSRLVALARKHQPKTAMFPPSPSPAPASAEDPTLLSGTRYRLVREIGRGAMGVVHEAFHVDLRRTVALKVLSKSSESAEQRARFAAEARAISRLQHENIVKLHDFGVTKGGRPFYAMELLHGETLDRYLERERCMPVAQALRLAIEACRALEEAHAAGIVHRDIKPANLFLTKDGGLKLLDFGIARVRREPVPGKPAEEALHIVGTPEYMAPEQATSSEGNERSDLYSLAVVLYEFVTGSLPHSAESTVQLIDKKLRQDPEPPSQRAPTRGLSKMFDKTIESAMSRDPEQRPESAKDMRRALEEALREPEIKRRRRRRAGFVAIGAISLGLIAVCAVGATKPDIRARAWASVGPVLQKLRGGSPPAPVAAAKVVTVESDTPAPIEQPAANSDEPLSAETKAAEPAPPAEEAQEATAAADEGAAAAESEADVAAAEKEPEAKAAEEEAEEEAAESEAKQADNSEPSFDAQPVTEPAEKDKIEEQLAKAAELMAQGAKVKGFNLYRRIGKNHRKDPRALKAWSEAAHQMKGHGEALRVAKQWAAVDKSIEAQMHLVQMFRVVGNRDGAIKTLKRLLKDQPNSQEARAMLTQLTGSGAKSILAAR